MEQEQLLNALRDARATIDTAIRWIANANPADQMERAQTGVCLFCGKPIWADQQSIRDVHRKPCYNTIKTLQRNGEVTLDEMVKAGRLGEPKPTGRPKKKASHIAELAEQYNQKKEAKE